jgi:hypothetical protein
MVISATTFRLAISLAAAAVVFLIGSAASQSMPDTENGC